MPEPSWLIGRAGHAKRILVEHMLINHGGLHVNISDLISARLAATGKLTFRTINTGGRPLSKHRKNAEAFQQGSTSKSARAWAALTAEEWDFLLDFTAPSAYLHCRYTRRLP